MKTLEDIKAMNYQEKDELEDLVLEAIDDNNLAKVKDILKDYPVKISCYELNIKDEDGDFPLFDPYYLIMRAAFACEENNNDFSILDYLFDEYGLSLKDPKYNFCFTDMKYIKEANEKYVVIRYMEDKPNIYKNALIYYYILNAKNPNSQIIQYLVNRGAKFEVHEDDFGWTPMHFWARRNNYELLELAIKGGANVDIQTRLIQESEYNETLLFEAVKEPETYRVTKLLIELGANVNFVTPTTPLDIARGSRNKKLLKDAGAMTSEQLDKKYNIYWDSKECEKDKSYMEKYCKLLNDAIKKAKENE
ncbi:ankyrin domain protein [Campylobacter subantarcticus LMG 24377]|uniref:ankyrin repeat domain-containing protein n=1 Tax=Campylobacter subantarcticus TaxID=497724 RepID=UPI00058211CD|nr:ankyrin repeat domain-containing protein [Campylobacter subantarcticus]AJC92594.1 ankyrin domain protein [Campylobacter subantarcticus LMG 24377]